jgi:hypothetical protein
MIKKLITKSRVTEVDAVSTRMAGAYKNSELSTDPHLSNMFNALVPLSANLSVAINRSKAESNLEEKDEKRDDNVRSLFYLIQGLLHHPDEAIKAAAKKVQKVFDKYGVGITGENFATESSLITSLLGDLAKPNLQYAIAQLSGCAEIIAALQASQDEFETARIAWEQEKAQEGTQTNATGIKKEVVDLINNKIVIYLHAMEIVDEPTYGAFARTVAEIIADNNEMVKKRRKKSEAGPAE